MSQLLVPRSRLLGVLLVSAGLLHCGGDDTPSPNVASGSSGTGGEPPSATPGGGAAAESELEIPTLNGCKAADYVDLSAEGAERTIQIAAQGLTFTPKCMIVSAAQTVVWQGSLSAHPLAPGNPENADAGSPESPIPTVTSGSSVEVTFPSAGTYPYYCQLHAFGTGQGMVGAVHVRSGS